MNSYLTIPLQTKVLFEGGDHPTCDLNMSIAHCIHLVNTTSLGECSFDEDFGTEVWNVDFDNLKSRNQIKTTLRDAILKSIKRNEKRLKDIRVDLQIKQEEINTVNSSNRIKKRVDIGIVGKVVKTNENFNYSEYFYIGPLSY